MLSENKTPNRLVTEKSPYLLQHAYNPVDWWPWCEEAFAKAKEEEKPVFLSIGYSTCHWCHVMAHESFEDEEVANLLNENYISIKVDKEERPDVDSIYMSVCQKLTGSGGWPLTIIMFPNQKPFFAGTYFPKKSKYRMPGLIELLDTVTDKWKTNQKELLHSSEVITNAISQEYDEDSYDGAVSREITEKAFHSLSKRFQKKYGGFSHAPKFPTPHNLMFLLRYAYHEKDDEALKMVEKTLESMFQGGIFDHVGYGFSRYSTDEKWLVPHFEKMLYDNALLIITYLEAYQITKKEYFKEIAEMTMSYIQREMTSNQGGFYSAQDADSEGIEGKFYVFTPKEIVKVLGEKEGKYFNENYNITGKGNFEGKNIPNLLHYKKEDLFNNLPLDNDRSKSLKKKLYDYRLQRTELHKDDKILTSWNGLMIVAFAKAYKILQNKEYLDVAKKAESFIREKLINEDRLSVMFRDGQAKGNGYIDDYAFYLWSLLELYEATLELGYLKRAINIYNITKEQFFHESEGGFYLYGKDNEELIQKPKELYDGAIPSGNSVAAYVLMKLSAYTADKEITEVAEKQLDYLAKRIGQYPSAYCFSLMALMLLLYPSKELVCVAKNNEDIKVLQKFLGNYYLPNVTVIVKTPENKDEMAQIAEFTKDYSMKDNELTFYLCENHVCISPFHGINELELKLQNKV